MHVHLLCLKIYLKYIFSRNHIAMLEHTSIILIRMIFLIKYKKKSSFSDYVSLFITWPSPVEQQSVLINRVRHWRISEIDREGLWMSLSEIRGYCAICQHDSWRCGCEDCTVTQGWSVTVLQCELGWLMHLSCSDVDAAVLCLMKVCSSVPKPI